MQASRPAATAWQAAPAAPSRSLLRRMLPFLFIGALLVAGTAVGAKWLLHGGASSASPSPDKGKPREEATFAVGIGHVDVPSRIVNLYPVQPGEVTHIPKEVAENAFVKKGGLLLRVDDQQAKHNVQLAADALQDARIKLQQAEKAPALHETLVRSQQAAKEAMERDEAKASLLHQKAKRLFESKPPLIQEEDYKAAFENLEKAKAGVTVETEKLEALKQQRSTILLDIDRAKVDVSAKKTRWEQAKHALEKCELLAPCDGSVLRLLVSVGDTLGPNPREPAIIFCPDQKRIIRAEIEQEFASKVLEGQPVLIQDDARLVGEWTGKVKRVSDWYGLKRSILQEPRQFNDVRTLECIVEIDDPKGLRIGQRVRVIIGKPKS